MVEHGTLVHSGYILAEGTNGEEQWFVFLPDIFRHLGKPEKYCNKQPISVIIITTTVINREAFSIHICLWSFGNYYKVFLLNENITQYFNYEVNIDLNYNNLV